MSYISLSSEISGKREQFDQKYKPNESRPKHSEKNGPSGQTGI